MEWLECGKADAAWQKHYRAAGEQLKTGKYCFAAGYPLSKQAAMGGQDKLLWIGPLECDLLWEQFGAECVVYDRRSGDTHFLNETAAAILKILQGGPATSLMVAARTRELFDMEVEKEAELIENIHHVLQGFDRAGLICPYQP